MAQFKAILAGHFDLYPGMTMSEATVLSWWSELGELPIEVLPAAFKKARAASPQFAATAPQVKAIAEADAAWLSKARAERRQERLFQPPAEKPDQALQDFYRACDLALRDYTAGPVGDQHETLITGVAIALLRALGARNEDAMRTWGRWWWNDCKQRKIDADACLQGMRKAPRYFRRAPTLGMLKDLVVGESLAGYPLTIVAPNGDALAGAA